uniref:Uncharacterized protein n=1 Tax=Schizaphis graminum TaxID=13262 RepID=A0A2S2P2H6_SCHGA
MWSIVNFTNDNSVSAVPSHWWKNGYCAWPKSSTKNASLLLQRRAIPNKFDYDFFKARKIHTKNPIKTYSEAKERARKAQFTSDLSSAEENYSNSYFNKHNIKKPSSPPVFSDNDDESVNNSLSNSQSDAFQSKINKSIKISSQIMSGTFRHIIMNYIFYYSKLLNLKIFV